MEFSGKIELTPAAQRTIKRLGELPDNMGKAVAAVLDDENVHTVGRIQKRYMSRRGSKTLGVVDNRLRPSVRPTRARASGTSVSSAIGSNVEYMGVHEFGYQGPQQIKAHTRRVNQAFGIPLDKPVSAQVKAHTRRVKTPERAPIRRGIRDRLPAYGDAISTAIVESV